MPPSFVTWAYFILQIVRSYTSTAFRKPWRVQEHVLEVMSYDRRSLQETDNG
jgi:hypothetical protein